MQKGHPVDFLTILIIGGIGFLAFRYMIDKKLSGTGQVYPVVAGVRG